MFKHIVRLSLPVALAAGSLGIVAGATASQAGAAVSHAAIGTHALAAHSVTWSGKVVKLNKTSFTFKYGKVTYMVSYSSRTKWTNKSKLKAGATAKVTGSVKGSAFSATAITVI